MNFTMIRRSLLIFFLSLAIIGLSRADLGLPGLAFFVITFTYLIFLELYIIRQTLLDVYAEAITDSGFLRFFLKRKFVNAVFTLLISVYLSVNLLLFSNLTDQNQLFFIGMCGLALTVITPSIVRPWIKPGPAAMFGRVAVIFVFVFLAVIVDATYNLMAPIDSRIVEPFDENIPSYVIADVNHSTPYFQHLLRSVKFLSMNMDSIELCAKSDPSNLCEKIDPWLQISRIFLALSPTPYVAIALVLLSIMSILRITIDRD